MKALVERILAEGSYLGNGILKVDSFLNHQLDPDLTLEMGRAFYNEFQKLGVQAVTKIVNIETSGIAPALTASIVYGVPLVYARKKRPITMPDGFFPCPSSESYQRWYHRHSHLTRVFVSTRQSACD